MLKMNRKKTIFLEITDQQRPEFNRDSKLSLLLLPQLGGPSALFSDLGAQCRCSEGKGRKTDRKQPPRWGNACREAGEGGAEEEGGDVTLGTTRGLGSLVTQEVFAIQASMLLHFNFLQPQEEEGCRKSWFKTWFCNVPSAWPTPSHGFFGFVSHLYWQQIVAASGCGSHDTSKAQGLRARLCDVIALHGFEAQCLAGQP